MKPLFIDANTEVITAVVVSLTRGSSALFPPTTETLRADSRALYCCPEDGRLTFGLWVVVVKQFKPAAISIY